MTDKYQGGIEVLVVLLDVVRIILGRLPLVHRVEVEAGIICLDGLEEGSQSVLEAAPRQRSATQATYASDVPLGIDLQGWGSLFALLALFSALHDSLRVLSYSWLAGRMVWAKQMLILSSWTRGKESLKRDEVAVVHCARLPIPTLSDRQW